MTNTKSRVKLGYIDITGECLAYNERREPGAVMMSRTRIEHTMTRTPNKAIHTRDAVVAMHRQVGMFTVAYTEMQRILDQAYECLMNESITSDEASAVQVTILAFHERLQAAGFDETGTIINEINRERCRLLNLYYAAENEKRGWTRL